MAGIAGTANLAVFCDFENIAIGVRESKYAQFDITKVLQRLLLKGSIIVKKAYCDWDRYDQYKKVMHQAAFELIEIPHVSMSGKNSADIRMVVDALDLCYTKPHVDTFVILSGDSDFSPLVSKLRENNKTVIGLGVKNSTADLLTASCDEFIFYDDLVRDDKPKRPRKKAQPRKKDGKEVPPREPLPKADEDKRQRAVDMVVETVDAFFEERGEDELIWGSMIKQAIKRRKPGFTESYHGYHSFSELLEDVQAQGLIELEKDAKSGGYIITAVVVEE
jgi:uncharacterized protein (TIGR00288 family)